MNVTIYIATSFAGPAVKTGAYMAIAEYITAAGTPVTRQVIDTEPDTTYNRMALLAAVKAMQLLKPCAVEIITGCRFVANTYQRGCLEDWQRLEWKRPSGERVKNKELWQQFLEQSQRMETVSFSVKNHHQYTGVMEGEIKKCLIHLENLDQ